jgi:hypothetical protein
MRYTVQPDPINAGPEDDFGFTESWEFFSDSKSYSPTNKLIFNNLCLIIMIL